MKEHRDPELVPLATAGDEGGSPSRLTTDMKKWAGPLVEDYIVCPMDPEMEKQIVRELEEVLAVCPACPPLQLPPTRECSSASLGDGQHYGFLPSEPCRMTASENVSVATVHELNRPYREILRSLGSHLGFDPTRFKVETHFDSKTAHLMRYAAQVECPEPALASRPDLLAQLHLQRGSEGSDSDRCTYNLSVSEIKSLQVATDAVFDGLDSLEYELQGLQIRVNLENEGTVGTQSRRVQIWEYHESPRSGPTPLRSLRRWYPAGQPLVAGACNLGDLAAYAQILGVDAGVFSSVMRHTPMVVDVPNKMIMYGLSRGHRMDKRRVDEGSRQLSAPLSPSPDPSLFFLRAALDYRILKKIPVPKVAPRKPGADNQGRKMSWYGPAEQAMDRTKRARR